jgi:hypothetical protein
MAVVFFPAFLPSASPFLTSKVDARSPQLGPVERGGIVHPYKHEAMPTVAGHTKWLTQQWGWSGRYYGKGQNANEAQAKQYRTEIGQRAAKIRAEEEEGEALEKKLLGNLAKKAAAVNREIDNGL